MDEKIIYRLNDEISFRKCSLFDGKKLTHGDCTEFQQREENWRQYFYCNNGGIHLHCSKHPEIEFDYNYEYGTSSLMCPRCKTEIPIPSFQYIINKCLRALNQEVFKDAKLIRLDDWYIPEIKEKTKLESGYWINTNVKTDKDGDTMVVLYVGHRDEKKKAQFFIKPEKLQLSSDHKDLDPAKVISKIEVTLKDRVLSQTYDD